MTFLNIVVRILFNKHRTFKYPENYFSLDIIGGHKKKIKIYILRHYFPLV